ncbi:MAG TPA: hypothetical protein VIW45_12830 [Vicinamibacterales bacterium]|jgi:hypothetical protein
MPDVTVTLHNNKISVDKQSVQASVSKAQRVTWTSAEGTFSIVFKQGSDWPNPPAARQQNGVWTTSAGPFNRPNITLEYGITASGYDPLDPEIQVVP